jgi:hypothetical protein
MVGLLAFFILPEIIEKIFFIRVRFPIIISLLIFSSILIIHTSKSKRIFAYGMVLLFGVLMILWTFFYADNTMQVIPFSLLFVYFSFITYYLFLDVLHSKEVTSSLIFGAFAGYFLIGVLFSFMFVLIDVAYPDTINVDMTQMDGVENTLYFSFITLTTIGYGDYAPTSTLGQKMAILEGLIGQFYIATIMATIVGKFLNSKTPSKD